jgi:hypothetical protein
LKFYDIGFSHHTERDTRDNAPRRIVSTACAIAPAIGTTSKGFVAEHLVGQLVVVHRSGTTAA